MNNLRSSQAEFVSLGVQNNYVFLADIRDPVSKVSLRLWNYYEIGGIINQ